MSAAVEARLTSQSKPTATIDLSLPKPIYHEKQSLMRCGVHTLNNLVSQPLHAPLPPLSQPAYSAVHAGSLSPSLPFPCAC